MWRDLQSCLSRALAQSIKYIACAQTTLCQPQGVLNYAFSDYLWAHAVLLLGALDQRSRAPALLQFGTLSPTQTGVFTSRIITHTTTTHHAPGPTIATLGLSVQIPIAAAVEAALGQAAWLSSGKTTAMTVGGTLLILLGFFWGNLAGKEEEVPGHHHRGEAVAAAGERGGRLRLQGWEEGQPFSRVGRVHSSRFIIRFHTTINRYK